MSDLMKIVEAEYSEARAKFPSFKAGDTINVHVRIKEGNKERIQQFQGTVIQRKKTRIPTEKPSLYVKFLTESA